MFQVKVISKDIKKTIVCSCHVTYTFQSEFTLYGCLNVKELLAQSRCKIWSCLWTKWLWVRVQLQSQKRLFHQSCFFLMSKSFHHWTNQITYKYTWFPHKIFVLYRKWKIKNVAVLNMRSVAHLEAFLIKKGMLF